MTNDQALRYYGSWKAIRERFGYTKYQTNNWITRGRIALEAQEEMQRDSGGVLIADRKRGEVERIHPVIERWLYGNL